MKKFEIGTVKVILERVASYISIINFGMLLYIYTMNTPLGLSTEMWILLIIASIPLIIIVDWYIIFPSALSVTFGKKNKEFIELKKDIKEIKECLKEKL